MSSIPNDVNHVAYCTANMKEQLTFYTQVIGMKLKALFWMHGVEGAMHAFLEMNPSCCLSFVYHPDVENKDPVLGTALPADTTDTVPAGVAQHIAFNMESQEELKKLVERVRSHGYMITDPVDHDMYMSAYMLGPENIWIEFTSVERPFSHLDIEAEVVELCGISPEELAAMENPPLDAGNIEVDREKTEAQQQLMGERMKAMLKKMKETGQNKTKFRHGEK